MGIRQVEGEEGKKKALRRFFEPLRYCSPLTTFMIFCRPKPLYLKILSLVPIGRIWPIIWYQ